MGNDGQKCERRGTGTGKRHYDAAASAASGKHCGGRVIRDIVVVGVG